MATQWFIVTDLGLTSVSGEDGLHAFVRSLSGADAVAGATVRLVAVNNEILGEVTTDAEGRALGDYWDWLKDISLNREYEGLAQPKPVDALKLHGRGKVRRIDLSDKIMGQPRFIHDLHWPGMRHGRVLRTPSLTAQLAHPDQPVPMDVLEARMRRFTAPVLVLQGQCDFVPYAEAYEYVDLFPDARYRFVAGAGHILWWERPAVYAQAIEAFIAEGASDPQR